MIRVQLTSIADDLDLVDPRTAYLMPVRTVAADRRRISPRKPYGHQHTTHPRARAWIDFPSA